MAHTEAITVKDDEGTPNPAEAAVVQNAFSMIHEIIITHFSTHIGIEASLKTGQAYIIAMSRQGPYMHELMKFFAHKQLHPDPQSVLPFVYVYMS